MTPAPPPVGRSELLATTAAAWSSRGAFLVVQILSLWSFSLNHGPAMTTLLAWCQGLAFLGFIADGGVCSAFQADADGVPRVRGYLSALAVRSVAVWMGSWTVMGVILPASHPVHQDGHGHAIIALVCLGCVLAAPGRLLQVLWVRRRRGWIGHGMHLAGSLLALLWLVVVQGRIDPIVDLLAILVLPALPSIIGMVLEGFSRPVSVGGAAATLVAVQAAMGFADSALPAWLMSPAEFSSWTVFQRLVVFVWYPASAVFATIAIRDPDRVFAILTPMRLVVVAVAMLAGALALSSAPPLGIFSISTPAWILAASMLAAVARVFLDAQVSAWITLGAIASAVRTVLLVAVGFILVSVGLAVSTGLGLAAPVVGQVAAVMAAVAWSSVRARRRV